MQIYPLTYSANLINTQSINRPAAAGRINFCAKIPDLNDFNRAINNRNKILYGNKTNFVRYSLSQIKKIFSGDKSVQKPVYSDHKWTMKEILSVEGLQHGLKIFEGLDIKQVYFLLDTIKQKGLNMPIVRGCYHNCSHCYISANPPIERMYYEDFHNFVSELSIMYKRFGLKPRLERGRPTALFHDSDGSELYLLDKNNNVHEFPELVHEIAEKLDTPSFVDTAGWNLKSEKTQKRMERLVSYYLSHPEAYNKEIHGINLSLNPFHSLRVTALNQLKKGNAENYNKLYNIYLDMVANTLNTFAPLLESDKLQFLCRAYPDNLKSPELDGFRVKDMEKIKQDVLSHFQKKYPETVKKYPKIIDILNTKITIQTRLGKSARDNNFSKYSLENRISDPPSEQVPDEKLIQDLMSSWYNRAFIDLNGDFYIINDLTSYKTNIKLNFNKKDTIKKMLPPVHFQTIEI